MNAVCSKVESTLTTNVAKPVILCVTIRERKKTPSWYAQRLYEIFEISGRTFINYIVIAVLQEGQHFGQKCVGMSAPKGRSPKPN